MSGYTPLLITNETHGLIFNSIFCGVLVALSLAFILLSSPKDRRNLIFPIQCVALCMTLVYCALQIESCDLAIRANAGLIPQVPNVKFLTTLLLFEQLTPLICDVSLLLKTLAILPRPVYSSTRRAILMAPLLILLVFRIPFIAATAYYYEKIFSKIAEGQPSAEVSTIEAACYITVYILQILYCSVASGVLLYKAATFYRRASDGRSIHLQKRVLWLIESFLMTFIPPIIAQICVVISAYNTVTSTSDNGKLSVINSYTTALNVYLSMIFSILASSWSTIRVSVNTNRRDSSDTIVASRRRPSHPDDVTGIAVEAGDSNSKSTSFAHRLAQIRDHTLTIDQRQHEDDMEFVRTQTVSTVSADHASSLRSKGSL